MTDVEIAKENLKCHSICVCKNGTYFTDDGKGISPMIRFIDEKRMLNGYSVADVIVGKAAALLFVKMGIVNVYGSVISKMGADLLNYHGVDVTYKQMVDVILNRNGTGICPMEKAIAGIDDIDEGYKILERIIKCHNKGNTD